MGNNRCCICNGEKYEVPFKQIKEYKLVRCTNCWLVYLASLPPDIDFILDAQKDISNKDKEKIEYWSFPALYKKHEKVFKYYFEDRLIKIKKFNPNISSVFDIGCGYGFWLKFCLEKGLRVSGIDLSQESIDWGKQNYNLNIKRKTIEELNIEDTYDLIVMCDVVEHLKDPLQQLKKIKGMLKQDGILYVQVPNVIGFKLPFGHGYGLPHHLWQFSIQTITKLLENAGFKVMDYHTGIHGVIGVYDRGCPTLKEKIIWWMAEKLKIGNRLQVIAKRY